MWSPFKNFNDFVAYLQREYNGHYSYLAPLQAPKPVPAQASPPVLQREGDRPTVDAEPSGTTLGKKFDQEKPRYDLIPYAGINEAAKVFAFGAAKYGDRNWELGLSYGRLYAALQRHLTSFWAGEELDPESGHHHLGHAACCLLMLSQFALASRDDLDDRSPL